MAAKPNPIEPDTYNFILVRSDAPEGKPLPIQGTLLEAEVLAQHLLRPGEALCVLTGIGTLVARWEAASNGKVERAALAA